MEIPPPLPPPTTPPPSSNAKNRKRKEYQSINDIFDEFGPATAVQFDPFQPESHQEPTAILPPEFPTTVSPLDNFSLFFTLDLIKTITKNTNRYAALQRQQDGYTSNSEGRKWEVLLVPELYVFLGAIIYMGVHEEPQISQYWNTDINIGPIHTLPLHLLQY
jgi:hypothetical protein